jgi:hypothetical protein
VFLPDEREQQDTGIDLQRITGRLPNDRWKYTGRMFQWKVFGDTQTVTTGDDKLVFFIPPELDGTKLVRIVAALSTNSSSGAVTIQFANTTQALDVLSTALTIDANEPTSLTAATPAVIKDTVVFRSGDIVAIDIDGAGTSAKGLLVHFSFI